MQRNTALSLTLLITAIISLDARAVRGAATITSLYSFTGGGDGAGPASALVQDAHGALYGTTVQGGLVNAANGGAGSGTIFCLSPDGAFRILHAFSAGSDGSNPYGLIWGTDGSLYGTTDNGGYDERNNLLNGGTVFKAGTNGDFSTIWICEAYGLSGARPNGLVWGSDGNLYGTAMVGGDQGDGTVFQMTPQGTMNWFTPFNSLNGSYPNGSLIQAGDGNFYGTTHFGGQHDVGLNGTIFRVTTAGALSRLWEFPSTGEVFSRPNGSLLEGPDGALYGTTFGTVFAATTNGTCSPLYAFTAGADGLRPYAGLTRGPDRAFYGTTADAGQYYCGTIFKIATNGVLTTLASFDGTNGAGPRGALLLGKDGNFYGTTWTGGTNKSGTIFRVSVTPDPTPLTPPITLAVNSGESTMAASLGLGYSADITARMERGDTSALTFEPAVPGDYDTWILPPRGMPLAGVRRVDIPPGDGVNGFYRMTFELPAGFWAPRLAGSARVFSSGRAFLNGNLFASSLDGPIETSDVTLFKSGTNELLIANANYLSPQYGYISGAAFSFRVSYQPAPVLQAIGVDHSTLALSWNAVVGARYQVQYADSFAGPLWIKLGEAITANSATASVMVPTGETARFYRIEVVP